ncbi:TNF receptor-associated factor 4, partial [Ilyodon furcidens]
IYPDPELEQQILALPIRCIHSEEGCRWTGQMKQLQGHFSTCAFNVIPCPNRCSVKLTRRDLPDHLQHDCPKRKVKCEFCGSEFTGEAYEVNTVHFVLFLSSYEYDGKMPGEKTHDVK